MLERHGGVVEKFIGDAVMAVFGVPRIHEDDALRAVRAAVEMREARARLNEELRRAWGVTVEARTGVNTGEVIAGDSGGRGQSFVVGDAVNTAARLEQAAGPGEILIGETTFRLVQAAVVAEAGRPLGPEGEADTGSSAAGTRCHTRARPAGPPPRLAARRADARARAARRDLRGDVDHGQEGELVMIMGAAGVGKSRLTGEFLSTVVERDATRDQGTLPAVRRGNHVLARGGGSTRRGRHQRARLAARRATEDRPLLGHEGEAALVADRLGPLLGAGTGRPGDTGDVLGRPEALRAARLPASAGGRLRRHPVGGADVPRPPRVPRRPDPGRVRCCSCAWRGRSCSSRPALDAGQDERDDHHARPADRAGGRWVDSEPGRRRARSQARRLRGSPSLPRAIHSSSRRRCACSSTTGCYSRRTGSGRLPETCRP